MEMEIEELRHQRDLAQSQVDELRRKLACYFLMGSSIESELDFHN